MPSATTASFDDDFISDRLLTFMHNGEYSGGSNNRASFTGLNTLGLPASTQKTFSLDKDSGLGTMSLNRSNPVTCNSPMQPVTNGYAVMASPHLMNKYPSGMISSAFTTPNPGNKVMDDYHSLQNSPFYNHYPLTATLKRQTDASCSNVLMNSNSIDCPPLVLSRRPPQRELFPSMPIPRCDNGWSAINTAANSQASGLFMQDRLFYNSVAQKRGYIVGPELERIKENSRRSTSHTYGRISAHFRNRYGETEAKTKASYMQLGVRVPSKDHVSEIVGKGGQKIKLIREETGALITTPGEYEDHVFIIEAPPEIALHVAELISTRAQEITQSKMSASERRRGSTSSIPGCMSLFSVNGSVGASSGTGGGRLVSRSPDDLPNASLPSPAPLLKTTLNSITPGVNSGIAVTAVNSAETFSFNSSNGTNSGVGNGLLASNGNNLSSSSGRILLARSKISVPQDMVGKIIGTQGSIITTIQKDTGTEIKSPPKEAARGPSATSEFEISAYQSLGMTSNQAAECRVQQAKQLIGHLVMRQFERRASEELEDGPAGSSNAGKSRSNSAGDEAEESKTSKTVAWMWPDVAQMDSDEAREVLDRILAESKSKTRRAKELAAAAAATTAAAAAAAGSLPGSPCTAAAVVGSGGNAGAFGADFFPTEKVTGSCHNSPFHQARVASQNTVFSTSSTTVPAQVNLLGGFLSERRLTTVDFHPEADFSDHHGICGASASTTAFWPSAARHSFSAGAPVVVGTGHSPTLLRRHTMASEHQHHLMLENMKTSGSDANQTGGFDFINTLESLCLSSDDGGCIRDELAYPPGFDNQYQNTDSDAMAVSSGWPATLFKNSGASDGLSSEGSVNSDAALRSIWSDAVSTNAANTNGGSGGGGFCFSVNPFSGTAAAGVIIPPVSTSNRCGAIGEGRRRASPPTGASAAPTEATSIPAV
ncbi:hypothetical protein ECG_06279 [Echinococcus granulosus]|uniref:RNA-binding protein MEX3B n=1 Tax=Echinococcus granulosus TaxID=6210 RepID=U6J6B3_ECHGR|nr:RNA-binding protein MEX3B [Echinococcus granulosus]EUB56606.1 RNA-binding protein MEX3B [Echinococcus granulosus]KAH9280389.1 hypothetical protein ECG_06279 [Echinococcus granulosus]CDS19629.1 RNA binding protein MEX3B [Echinococcus granulosus]